MLGESFATFVNALENIKKVWNHRGVDACTQRRILISALLNMTLATLLTHRQVHDQMMETVKLADNIETLREIALDLGHSTALLLEQADPASTYSIVFGRRDRE